MSACSRTTDASSHRVSWLRILILTALLGAFALRAYQLDAQSLWSDEGISLQRAAQPLVEMLAQMPVEHAPGYFVLLGGWMRLTGRADYALRYLSLLASVLSVALIFRLGLDLHWPGRRPTSATVALSASLLLATSSFQVWYAQETRMYAWLLAASAASSWALWRLLEHPGHTPGWWVLTYALTTAAAVYLHYYGALVPIAQTIFVAGWAVVRRERRGLLRWFMGAIAAFLLFVPWLPRASAIFGFQGWREPGIPAEIPWRYLSAYTAGVAMPDPWRTWLPWFYVVLGIGGVWYWMHMRRMAAFLLLVLLGVPLTGVLALALNNPDYHERYTIFLSIPLISLAAGSLGLMDLRFWRTKETRPSKQALVIGLLAPTVVMALLMVANLQSVARQNEDEAFQRPDFRAAAREIMAHLEPGDVVLVDGPDPEKVFLHYYSGSAPVIAVADLEHVSLEDADERLSAELVDAERVWELLYFHNPATVQVWLATRGWATDPTYHSGIWLTLYGLDRTDPVTNDLNLAFGTALTLKRVDVDTLSPAPGDLLQISTHWFTREQAPEYKFSLRLANMAGEVVATADYVPQNWFAPTNVWLVGQPATDQRGLLLPEDLPPGEYRLTLRLYDPNTGAPVETGAGQDVLLATLTVGR